jgi:hypothetical protein
MALENIMPPTPCHHLNAIHAVSCLNGNFPLATQSAIITAFHHDITAADTYMAIEEADYELRHMWIHTVLVMQCPLAESFDSLE